MFFIPEITYSIARAPRSNPNTLCITLKRDILNFSTNFDDNHIEIPAKITAKVMGMKLIKTALDYLKFLIKMPRLKMNISQLIKA